MNMPAAWARSALAVGTSSMCGDLVCQRLHAADNDDFTWDARRTASFGLVGFVALGPASHGFELLLEKLAPGSGALSVAKKVGARVVSAPVFLSISFGGLALLGGRDVMQALSTGVLPAWYIGSFFWPPVSIVLYRYVSLTARPAAASLVGAGWATYISFVANDGERHVAVDAAAPPECDAKVLR
ncbi:hypothetical protein M885DRAFT_546493 [Pelagophyceae sp. CCMP2097]|nr:hypothetical protein M885DRAFT_546493 [Pelagophyceae sp. CCMP2097]|mmetsp:Transcript_7813/g.25486  ORF Transcript_7813/g.25486 Transcript_7813/m.25486 type:complete len:185 (-) Transcript_7813:36-590(-)